MQFKLAAGRHLFIFDVALIKRLPVQVMQIFGIVRREQGPATGFADPLHEQVRDPVGGIHVMGTAPVITGIFAQIQELLDIEMPAFQVCTHGAFALPALVDGNGGVIGNLEKGHDSLGFPVGPLDMRAH